MNEYDKDFLYTSYQLLITACTNLKESVDVSFNMDSSSITNELMNALNKLFSLDSYECTKVLLTLNTDKIPFGVIVNPTITDVDLMSILLEEDSNKITRYGMEIDLRLCPILEVSELAAYIVEEIASTLSPVTMQNVKATLDMILSDTEESIDIKQSVNYSQLLIFGIKDTIRKFASVIYKAEDAIGVNKYVESLEIKEELYSLTKKIRSCVYDDGEVSDYPKLGTLSWVLSVYTDIELNYRMMKEMLQEAACLTGSQIEKIEIQKTLRCLQKALSEIVTESAHRLDYMLYEAKGLSLFKSLKLNGLRAIEDDLYEFKIRLKNAETEDDAIYILRQINTRISILEDYISSSELSEGEANHWRSISNAYRDLRIELSKKKIGYKKSYGVFVDYDKFDAIKN